MRRSLPLLLGLAVAASWVARGDAADHAEAPAVAANPLGDIGDLYAWKDGGSLFAVITYAPLLPAGGSATFDDAYLYQLHVDTDADGVADESVSVRFGQDAAGDWGVQATFELPGTDPVLEGAVDTVLTGADVAVWAGLADDPFFFDAQGLGDTLSTASIAFDSSRDFFAGRNIMAIALERPAPAGAFQVWATSAEE